MRRFGQKSHSLVAGQVFSLNPSPKLEFGQILRMAISVCIGDPEDMRVEKKQNALLISCDTQTASSNHLL